MDVYKSHCKYHSNDNISLNVSDVYVFQNNNGNNNNLSYPLTAMHNQTQKRIKEFCYYFLSSHVCVSASQSIEGMKTYFIYSITEEHQHKDYFVHTKAFRYFLYVSSISFQRYAGFSNSYATFLRRIPRYIQQLWVEQAIRSTFLSRGCQVPYENVNKIYIYIYINTTLILAIHSAKSPMNGLTSNRL